MREQRGFGAQVSFADEDQETNSYLSPEDVEALQSFGISIGGEDLHGLVDETVKGAKEGAADADEKEEEEEIEDVGGSFFTFSYMVWGILLCCDVPLTYFALIFNQNPDLSLFSQALAILFQVTLISWFRPFDPDGINYYACVAGFIEFLIAGTSGFLTLFNKFVNTPLGEAYRFYIPMIENLANYVTAAIIFWSLALVFGKLLSSFVRRPGGTS